MNSSTEQMLIEFVAKEILRGASAAKISADQPLIDGGIIDSLGLQQLVGFLENKLDLEFDDDDLIPENFATISTLAKLVDSVR